MGRPKLYRTKEEELEAKRMSKKKWAKRNQERVNYIRAKSFAKKFIQISDNEDLKWIEKLTQKRKEELKNIRIVNES